MNASAEPLIATDGLVLKAFPESEPIRFAIGAGEHRLVVGEAGSGKTSLAKTLIGMVSPRGGELRLFGADVDTLAPAQLLALRGHLGVVFANDGLIPAWTGYDNVALPLRRLAIFDDAGVEAAINDWRERYRIPQRWLDTPCGALGRDARWTLAFCRALIAQPKLLLLDGAPIDLASGYSRTHGLGALADFVAGGGALLVFVRDAFVERVPERAIGANFLRQRLRAGVLESWADESGSPSDSATAPSARPR